MSRARRAVALALLSSLSLLSIGVAPRVACAQANPYMTKAARDLLVYIKSNFARGVMMAGQHEDIWFNQGIDTVWAATGRYPAIRGIEVGLCSSDERMHEVYDTYLSEAVIPTFTWHAVSPDPNAKDPDTGTPCPSSCSFNCVHDQPAKLSRVLTPGTIENTNFLAQLNRVLQLNQYFKDRGVPVIFRPFHEMTNTAFWWGWYKNGTPAEFVQLWRMVWDYCTRYNPAGLYPDNFIWVWSGNGFPGRTSPFYPGHPYVDVVGTDIYTHHEGCAEPTATIPDAAYTSWRRAYRELSDPYYGGKPIALTETEFIPDADRLAADGVKLAWFLAWEGPFLRCNERRTSPTMRDLYLRSTVVAGPGLGDHFGTARELVGPVPNNQTGYTFDALDNSEPTFSNDYDSAKNPSWNLCRHSPGAEMVWKVRIPAGLNSAVTIDTRNTVFDTVLYVLSSSGQLEACNDDALGAGGVPGLQSRVSLVLRPGTHYVVVDAYDANGRGRTELNFSYQPAVWSPAQ